MPSAQTGEHGLEVDIVRFHRLIIRCSDSDFERLLDFAGAPGFEVISAISPCRSYTATEGLALTPTGRKVIKADKEDQRDQAEDEEEPL